MSYSMKVTVNWNIHSPHAQEIVRKQEELKEEYPNASIGLRRVRKKIFYPESISSFDTFSVMDMCITGGEEIEVTVDGCPEMVERRTAEEIGSTLEKII